MVLIVIYYQVLDSCLFLPSNTLAFLKAIDAWDESPEASSTTPRLFHATT
jgi:hypothetical protein